MDQLLELANAYRKGSIEHLVFGQGRNSSQLKSFFDLLMAGELQSDEEAAEAIFQSDASDQRYHRLKNKLKSRLINASFLIDAHKPSYSTVEESYSSCLRDWAAAQILLEKNALKTAVSLLEKTLRHAIRFEFEKLIVFISLQLRRYYASRFADQKKFEYYTNLFYKYHEIQGASAKAEEYFQTLLLSLSTKKTASDDLSQKALAYFDELEPLMKQYDNGRLFRYGYLIKVTASMSAYDYQAAADNCKEAISILKAKESQSRISLISFMYQQLVCHIQLKQYEEGEAIIEDCLSLTKVGRPNWYKFHELRLLLALHSGHYQEAYSVFLKTMEEGDFSKLGPIAKENWKIYEAYIYYLLTLEKIEQQENDKVFNKFRQGKFMNEVPMYSKDKRGMNIPILIVQILFMIARKNYDRAFERIEAIEKYCSRYLRKEDTFRSNCFIRMILQIPISGFHRAGVQRRAEKYYKRLKDTPLEIANQAHELEILPYEDLWELALESLQLKFVKLKSNRQIRS